MARNTLTGKTIFGMRVGEDPKKDRQTPWTKIIVHPTGKKVQKGATWTDRKPKKQVWVTVELKGDDAEALDAALEASREKHRAARVKRSEIVALLDQVARKRGPTHQTCSLGVSHR